MPKQETDKPQELPEPKETKKPEEILVKKRGDLPMQPSFNDDSVNKNLNDKDDLKDPIFR